MAQSARSRKWELQIYALQLYVLQNIFFKIVVWGRSSIKLGGIDTFCSLYYFEPGILKDF